MYKNILVTLDMTPTDRAIIEHVKQLATAMGSRVMLLHVATGVPARGTVPAAAGEEVEEDRAIWKMFAPNSNPPASGQPPSWRMAIRSKRSLNGSPQTAAIWSP